MKDTLKVLAHAFYPDECHRAKNLIPDSSRDPTATGRAVKELQDFLPNARVVYCSATGATVPSNMVLRLLIFIFE